MPSEIGGKAVDVMREVAKSMVRFSWAVSLFGFQQMSKLLAQSDAAPEGVGPELDEVSRVVQGHLSEPLAQQFKAGDEWQRRVVDVLFDAALLRSLDPRTVAAAVDPRPLMEGIDPRDMMQTGVDVVQKSVDAVRQAAQDALSALPGGAASAA
ncbi:MAG: hypothetical protein ACHQO8_10345 [Vicinamibacterales bacterium]